MSVKKFGKLLGGCNKQKMLHEDKSYLNHLKNCGWSTFYLEILICK